MGSPFDRVNPGTFNMQTRGHPHPVSILPDRINALFENGVAGGGNSRLKPGSSTRTTIIPELENGIRLRIDGK